jgi:ribosomal protein L31
VTAQQAAKVTIAVRYKGTKTSHTVHSTVGSSGMLVKLWRVPKTAPLGTAKITVSISTESHPFSLQLTVTK